MVDVKGMFQEIEMAFNEDPSHRKGVEATYQFDLKEDGTYHLVLKSDGSYASEGEHDEPDCILRMNVDDFEKLATGQLNGTKAFMSGRLKIKGNMGLVLKLQDILATYNKAKK